MIKVEVIENFTLKDFDKIKNVSKVASRKDNEFGVKDTFECDKDMAEYLTGKNAFKKVVVKVIEVIPEKKTIVKVDKMAKEIIEETPIIKEKPKKKKFSKK